MKTKRENKEGISLIVLVITIIVMVILAGAIILTLNNSGIIDKASEAVDETNLATVKEVASMKWAEAYSNKLRKQEDIEKYVLEGLTEAGIKTDKYKITVTTTGVEVALKGKGVTIPTEWAASVVNIVDTVPIPKGFVASSAKGENTKDGGLVIYEGTEQVNDANVEDARRERNQYVWVPVDTATFDTTFVRKDFGMGYSTSSTLGTSSEYWEVLPTTELNTTNLQYMTEDTLDEVQAMYASVKKYGGFYIARYEAGIDAQRTARGTSATELPGIKEGTSVYSVMGKIPYTYIPWTWNEAMNEDTNGAVEVARRMYPESNTNYGVVSTLTYGVQWDRTLQWFIDTGAMTEGQVNKTEGSAPFGSYSDHVIEAGDLNLGAKYASYSVDLTSYQDVVYDVDGSSTSTKASKKSWLLSTGALKAANVNNIYDMAGNLYEWVMEGYSTNRRAYRGGYYGITGNKQPLSHRTYGKPNAVNPAFGFRPSLYIK